MTLGDHCQEGIPFLVLLGGLKLKLKKVGKTSRPIRYDLNQILYDFTVEETNRFNWLDQIDRVPEEGTEVCNTILLMLLLSHFSRVRLCVTP